MGVFEWTSSDPSRFDGNQRPKQRGHIGDAEWGWSTNFWLYKKKPLLSLPLLKVFKLAGLSVIEMYASSMRVQIESKKNDFSFAHYEISDWKDYSVVSENKLFEREEAFLSRRILVTLATVCEQFPRFSSKLFTHDCEYGELSLNFMAFLSLTIKNYSLCVRCSILLSLSGNRRPRQTFLFVSEKRCKRSRFHRKCMSPADNSCWDVRYWHSKQVSVTIVTLDR